MYGKIWFAMKDYLLAATAFLLGFRFYSTETQFKMAYKTCVRLHQSTSVLFPMSSYLQTGNLLTEGEQTPKLKPRKCSAAHGYFSQAEYVCTICHDPKTVPVNPKGFKVDTIFLLIFSSPPVDGRDLHSVRKSMSCPQRTQGQR